MQEIIVLRRSVIPDVGATVEDLFCASLYDLLYKKYVYWLSVKGWIVGCPKNFVSAKVFIMELITGIESRDGNRISVAVHQL